MSYDSSGNVTSTVASGTAVDPDTNQTVTSSTSTQSTMSADRNFVTQIKDELDHTTLYEYDSYYSVLNATTNAK